MGIIDDVRYAALRTKARGEAALLEREISKLKAALGVDLYDSLVAFQAKNPSKYPLALKPIRPFFDQCRTDITAAIEKKELMETEFCNYRNDCNSSYNSSNYINDKANEARVCFQVANLNRTIKISKENFGMSIFDVLTSCVEAIGKKSDKHRDLLRISTIIDTFTREISSKLRLKEAKVREVNDCGPVVEPTAVHTDNQKTRVGSGIKIALFKKQTVFFQPASDASKLNLGVQNSLAQQPSRRREVKSVRKVIRKSQPVEI